MKNLKICLYEIITFPATLTSDHNTSCDNLNWKIRRSRTNESVHLNPQLTDALLRRLKRQLSKLVLFQQQRMLHLKKRRSSDNLTSFRRKSSAKLSRPGVIQHRLGLFANKGLRCFNLLRQTKLQTGRSGHDREPQVHELINCLYRYRKSQTELHGIQREYLCV